MLFGEMAYILLSERFIENIFWFCGWNRCFAWIIVGVGRSLKPSFLRQP